MNVHPHEKICKFLIKLTHSYFAISAHPGPGCSKLLTLLLNVSLKFQTLISEIHQYFFVEKLCEA